MRADFVLVGDFDQTTAGDLRLLGDQLRQSDLAVASTTIAMAGVKDPLTIGLAIASLSVSALGLVVSTLSLWAATRPKYSVSVQRGGITQTIANVSGKDAQAIVAKLNANSNEEPITVRIERRI